MMAEVTRTAAEKLSLVSSSWCRDWTPVQRMGWAYIMRRYNPLMSAKEKKRLLNDAAAFVKLHNKPELAKLLN